MLREGRLFALLVKLLGVIEHLALGVRVEHDLLRRAVVEDAQGVIPRLDVLGTGVLVDVPRVAHALDGVLGMSATLAATIGTFRTYGCRLIGGPLGGFLADKTFKSVSKEQVLGQTACVVTLGIFLILPVGTNSTVLVILLLLVGVAMFLCKGTYFSVQPELGIPTKVSATAVAIATLIGYLPDMFVHTMFGNWIDQYGAAGYNKILLYGVGTAVLGIIAAVLAVVQSKKIAKRKAAEQAA